MEFSETLFQTKKKKIVKRQFLEKLEKELGMVVHAFHSGPQEVEVGGSP